LSPISAAVLFLLVATTMVPFFMEVGHSGLDFHRGFLRLTSQGPGTPRFISPAAHFLERRGRGREVQKGGGRKLLFSEKKPKIFLITVALGNRLSKTAITTEICNGCVLQGPARAGMILPFDRRGQGNLFGPGTPATTKRKFMMRGIGSAGTRWFYLKQRSPPIHVDEAAGRPARGSRSLCC